MMKIKISEAVFNDYVTRLSSDPLAFPKAWPGQVGLVEVDEDMAHLVQLDAEKMAKASKPKMAMAYRSLANQVAECRKVEETLKSVVVEREKDVSQRNSGEFIQLARAEIIVLDQVRTEIDEESIDELAEDIEANGLINPITVRPGDGGMFYLVAGERRMRACTLAGVPIVAKVIQGDEGAARRIQLAENVHREDLSLKDKARAVGELYNQLGTMQAVADQVKKSKGWVSKLVAIENGLSFWPSKVLDEGISEDMEVLALLTKIDLKSDGTNRMWSIYKKMKAGEMGRAELQEVLRDIKKKEEKKQVEQKEARSAEPRTKLEHQTRKEEAVSKEECKYVVAEEPDELGEAICQAWVDYGKQDLMIYLRGGLNLGAIVHCWTLDEQKDLEFLLDLVECME